MNYFRTGVDLGIGLLESSDAVKLFNDVLAGYTVFQGGMYHTGTAPVTALTSIGTNNFSVINLGGNIDVVTDGDGTKWFNDPDEVVINSQTATLASADELAIEESTDGLITVESYRMTHDQTKTLPEHENCGIGFSLGAPSKTFWRNIFYGSFPGRNMEIYHQVVPDILDAAQHQLGPFKGGLGEGGGLIAGGFNTTTNVLTVPAYTAGMDIVWSWFFQENGIRLMINGQFVQLYDTAYLDLDGSINNPSAHADILVADWRMRTLHINAGGTPGDGLLQSTLNFGKFAKQDYAAVFFDSTRSDDDIAQMHGVLLNQKLALL